MTAAIADPQRVAVAHRQRIAFRPHWLYIYPSGRIATHTRGDTLNPPEPEGN